MINPPPRLRDDDSCPSELRAEIQREASRSGDDDPAWMQANLARLHGAIAAGATLTFAPKVSALSAKLPWIALSIGAATVVAALVALAAVRHAPQTPPQPVDHRPAPAMTVQRLQNPEPQASNSAPAIDILDLPKAPARLQGSSVASAPAVDPFAEESAHLIRLRATAQTDPAAALAAADEGNQRFPDGLFGQEREAIAIGALVRLGRDAEAQARGARFLAAHPTSPFAERIRNDISSITAHP
jgi:hypothetical protein